MYRHHRFTMLKRLRPKRQPFVVAVCLHALLMYAFIPFAQAIPVPQDNGLWRALVICTAYGLQSPTATPDRDMPATGDADTSPTGPFDCPVCTLQHMAQTAYMPPAVALAQPRQERGFRLAWHGYIPPAMAPILRPNARAPPMAFRG
jgi:hypothetical protein